VKSGPKSGDRSASMGCNGLPEKSGPKSGVSPEASASISTGEADAT
jgi:hypothetical protein